MSKITYSVLVVDPEGDEMWLRHGCVPGEGEVVRFATREEAQEQVKFLKMGMEQGEDYESISIVRSPKGEPQP